MYRSSDNTGWDPCGAKDTHKGYQDCKFHANILKEKCDKQIAWLKPVVDAIPSDDWKIAVSHAPFDLLDVEDLTTILQKARFDLYLNGHVHNLAHYTLDNDGATYIQSGAGCMVNIKEDKEYVKNELKINPSFLDKHAAYRKDKKDSGAAGHQHHYVWEDKVAGFTTHTFSSNLTQLTTTFVDNNGKQLYSAVTTKGAARVPALSCLRWYWCPRDPSCTSNSMNVNHVETQIQSSSFRAQAQKNIFFEDATRELKKIKAGDTLNVIVRGTTTMTVVPPSGTWHLYALNKVHSGNLATGLLSAPGVLMIGKGTFVLNVSFVSDITCWQTDKDWFEFGLTVYQEKSEGDEGMCIEVANPKYAAHEVSEAAPPFTTDCEMDKLPFKAAKGGVKEVLRDVTCTFLELVE